MHKTTAYERRERLDADQLDQLLVSLRNEVKRYRDAIRGYGPEKMARHRAPYLSKLEEQAREVERLLITAKPNAYHNQNSPDRLSPAQGLNIPRDVGG